MKTKHFQMTKNISWKHMKKKQAHIFFQKFLKSTDVGLVLSCQLYESPPIPQSGWVIARCGSYKSCKLTHITVTSLTDKLCKMTHHRVTEVTHNDALCQLTGWKWPTQKSLWWLTIEVTWCTSESHLICQWPTFDWSCQGYRGCVTQLTKWQSALCQ